MEKLLQMMKLHFFMQRLKILNTSSIILFGVSVILSQSSGLWSNSPAVSVAGLFPGEWMARQGQNADGL